MGMKSMKVFGSAILAWGLLLSGTAAAGSEIHLVDSLKAEGKDANTRKVPILLVFTSPHCKFCERVKAEYLGPMAEDAAWKDKVIIRQIEAGGDWDLIDFNGKKTTHGAFAASQKIQMVPTVKVMDGSGKPLADPIIGLLIPDFYYGSLQSAIEQGLEKLRGATTK